MDRANNRFNNLLKIIMMKYLKFIILSLLILAAVACGKKIHISDVTMRVTKYYHCRAYAWEPWDR